MPRKKAEPEVLQEETVQPEIAQVEETVTAEQPVLEPQVEEPAITEPVQPYGEDDVPAAAEKSESIFSVRNCGFPVVSHAVSDFWMTIFTKIVVSVEILRKISVWYTFAYYRPTIFPKICFFPSSYRWITTMTVSPVLKSESS